MDKLEKIPFKTDMDVMKELEEIASLRSLTPQEMWDYDCALNSYRSNEGAWRAMERKVVEAEALAAEADARLKAHVAKVEAKAAKAEAKANENAKKVRAETEAKTKAAVAKELKRLNMPIATIAQVTKLSEAEIETL